MYHQLPLSRQAHSKDVCPCFTLTYESVRFVLLCGLRGQPLEQTLWIKFIRLVQTVFALAPDQEWYLCFCVCTSEGGFCACNEYICSLCCSVWQHQQKAIDESACELVLLWLWLEVVMRRVPHHCSDGLFLRKLNSSKGGPKTEAHGQLLCRYCVLLNYSGMAGPNNKGKT